MTPNGEVTLKDVYELMHGVRNELKSDIVSAVLKIDDVKKAVDDDRQEMAAERVNFEKRFGTIEKCIEVIDTRIIYIISALGVLGTVLGALVYFHWA